MTPHGERWFPLLQGGRVDWPAAEQAYRDYARRYGAQQSLELLAQRGGFGLIEFCELYRGKPLSRVERGTRREESIGCMVLAVADELGARWQRGEVLRG